MSEWECENSIFTNACRRDVWAYWSDMRNHAKMEPGVEKIELDGPFATGTTGRTITANYRQEWELSEVIPEKRFVITGEDAGFTLSFAWDFGDEGTGTRMTQRITANGPETQMKQWADALRQMEINAPKAMAPLAADLDRLAEEMAQRMLWRRGRRRDDGIT